MIIYKFGGASIANVDRMKESAGIMRQASQEKRVIVISAMGKTTNALEKVVDAFMTGNKEEAIRLFHDIKRHHNDAAKFLCTLQWKATATQLERFYTEVEWMLHDNPQQSYDYYYDQIVCSGEMLSSTLVYHHLLEAGANVCWVDIRDAIRTDNNFRDPGVNWLLTEKLAREKISPLFEQHDIIITQGFVGCTEENESTTLGREGSDYTAAILAHTMNAESVTIWKDVESVMNADPRRFPNAEKIPQLNYAEVIEMAFYGAQVIHPKTIKPLRNKNIPLLVKSFLNTKLPGTRIDNINTGKLPPIIVEKEKQVLITFTTRDFSFMEDDTVKLLHELFAQTHSKPNLTQRTAISFLACLDDRDEKIHQLASAAAEWFEVSMEKNLSLYTVRHYLPGVIEDLKKGTQVLVEQITSQTMQWVCR